MRGKINRRKLNLLTCKYFLIYFSLPKNYYYPPGVPYSTKITKFSWEVNLEDVSEVSEPTVKYVPIKGSGKPRTGPHMPRL